MENKNLPSWDCGKVIAIARVKNWEEFLRLIETDFLDWPEYIYRGQRDTNWPLRSKFDREYRRARKELGEANIKRGLCKEDLALIEQKTPDLSLKPRSEVLDRLISQFKISCTGRRGQSPKQLKDIEWWTLGQHFGLSTPLLDWTRSPYVAAYFALEEPLATESGFRAMWAYTNTSMREICINMEKNTNKSAEEIPLIEIVEGLVDENSRIVSQSGLFTKAPSGEDVEEFIENNIDLNGHSPILYKIEIPNEQRETFLRQLDAMNIHYGSLFPDLEGAARYANRGLERESTDLLWQAQPSYIRRMLSNNACHDANA